MRDILQCARQSEQEQHYSPDDRPHNSTGSMPCDGVQSDGESQNVTTHSKDQKDSEEHQHFVHGGHRGDSHLCSTKQLPAYRAKHHLTRICHVMHMRICLLELSIDIASISRNDSKSYDENNTGDQTNSCQD